MGGRVSDDIRKTMLVYPELNIAKDVPISDTGYKISKKAEKAEKEELIEKFSKNYKLLFFYEGNCNFCKHYAEVIEAFATRYGFKVSAVTLDGKQIERFPGKRDLGLAKRLKVRDVPSLYGYSEEKGVAVPLSNQYLAINELQESVAFVAKQLKENGALE